ncbi:hypothetical protein HYQ45_005208 [Verticillium longisporum]|uniref:Up-regulated during septation protein 1 domain-containing protein n=1 Tax=Verticillium longisporum TaxID=100787 RepID=A0A8I3ASD2_VERLO|nr:hypothetical protein HYQ45_005208 [Verticillium longisporum]
MAHIATCMVEADLDRAAGPGNGHLITGLITKPPSPTPSSDSSSTSSQASEQKPHVWRMQQTQQQQQQQQQQQHDVRKYQLFPKGRPQPAPVAKALDPEQARAYALGQTALSEKDKEKTSGGGLRVRIKEHNLIRRRKVSVPELGPMTTVQEVAMDSPTIPGRPPLHERSISAPGNSWRRLHVAEAVACVQDSLDENAELEFSPTTEPLSYQRSASEAPRQPMSPKNLAPLVIPPPHTGMFSGLTRQLSLSRLRSGNTPSDSVQRSARTDDSPLFRTPYTPLTASTSLTTPMSSTTTHSAVALPTPVSAPLLDVRASPKPSEAVAFTGSSSSNNTPKKEIESRAVPMGHRRGQSETGSIMERGRPRKRTDRKDGSVSAHRAESARTRSTDQKAFEELPSGCKASEAANQINQIELLALQKQAFGQASRFEVLRKEDVESLSRELRQLDERTEYLRRTYHSLRAGRRNLHSRICQYLRSPRVARFSTDSMLKQEEALGELDASIDDWVNKLEHAENRRARVRQKLLEHVAAAAILPNMVATPASDNLQQAMGARCVAAGVGNISTPPRSPTKNTVPRAGSNSPSPQRVVAHVPSTILEDPAKEDILGSKASIKGDAEAAQRREDVESIRVYADSDVYALLADVESEIAKMSADSREESSSPLSADERKDIHRARSHEMLNGRAEDTSFLAPPTPTGPTDPFKDAKTPSADGETIFLTSAVFKP